jgi:hypothetical protein
MRERARYSERRAAGLCVACGQQPAAAGTCCVACAAAKRAAEAARRERLRRAGICVDCAREPAASAACRCPTCLEQQRRRVSVAPCKGRDVTLDVTLPCREIEKPATSA